MTGLLVWLLGLQVDPDAPSDEQEPLALRFRWTAAQGLGGHAVKERDFGPPQPLPLQQTPTRQDERPRVARLEARLGVESPVWGLGHWSFLAG
jgi:hypothetical protein